MELIKEILNSKKFREFDTIFNNGKMVHAYLIVGNDTKSNKAFSYAMAMKLVCEKNEPCLECAGCKKILAGFHPDVLIYPKGKNFVVSDSEDILSNANIKPMEANYKIFIINSIDVSTVQAQNKLLKTVEEAPKNVVFIFNAVNSHNVLQTIKSRTQIIEIDSIEQTPIEKQPDFNFLCDMINNLSSSKQTLNYAVKFAEKNDFEKRLVLLGELYETLLYEKTTGNYKLFSQVANEYQFGAIAEILQLITNAKRQFQANVNTNLITDNLLMKILEVKFLWNKK